MSEIAGLRIELRSQIYETCMLTFAIPRDKYAANELTAQATVFVSFRSTIAQGRGVQSPAFNFIRIRRISYCVYAISGSITRIPGRLHHLVSRFVCAFGWSRKCPSVRAVFSSRIFNALLPGIFSPTIYRSIFRYFCLLVVEIIFRPSPRSPDQNCAGPGGQSSRTGPRRQNCSRSHT